MNTERTTAARRTAGWRHVGTAGFVFFFAKGMVWLLAAALVALLR